MEGKKANILVVDDEWNMRNLIGYYLRNQGWNIIEATSGIEALQEFNRNTIDLLILDIMMPQMDGWEVCSKVREKSNVPILLLTARTETKDKVFGLNLGADDYLTKPFEMEELVARVHALLRRVNPSPNEKTKDNVIKMQELEIYPNLREVKVHGESLSFTPKEYDLLYVLADNPSRAYARETLLELIWGSDYFGDDRTVDQHVKNIREKVKKAGCSFNFIQTVWGVGYRIQGSKINE